MANENPLLMNRTQFPVKISGLAEVCDSSCEDERDWEIIYPPVHPSIIDTGIELKRASGVIDEAVEDSIKDLMKMATNVLCIRSFLECLKDPKSERHVLYKKEDLKIGDERIEISPFSLDPGFSQLNIKRDGIYFGGGRSGSASTFSPERDNRGNAPFQYYIGRGYMSSSLPEELAKEYELKPVERDGKIMCHTSRNYWRWHNLDFLERKIFCKNFAIAYNNAVVREKYRFSR